MTKGTKQKLGVIIGRFQPLHEGHCKLIRKSLAECEVTLVFLGSSNKLPDYMDPLSLAQRRDSLVAVFGKDILVYNLPDFPSEERWVAEVIGTVQNVSDDENPALVTLYTSEEDRLYYENLFIYTIDSSVREQGLSASSIRKGLYDCAQYLKDMKNVIRTDHRIPKETYDILDTVDWRTFNRESIGVAQESKSAELHPYDNLIEPVVHALVVQDGKVLLVTRRSYRGDGQLAIPGGYLEKSEETWKGAPRELLEETGVDLEKYRALQLACVVEENLDDYGNRTLGINYLYAIHPDEDVKITHCDRETYDVGWYDVGDVIDEKLLLFYNHNQVAQRLFAAMDKTGDTDETNV